MALPRLAVLSVLSAASSPCPDLNLIHYNFYNTVKPYRSLNGDTPFEALQAYFSQPVM